MMNPKGSCKAAFLVQINNIEFLTLTLNQVAGGGLFSEFKKMQDTFTFKESDSTVATTVKTVGGLALLGVVTVGIFKTVFRGY